MFYNWFCNVTKFHIKAIPSTILCWASGEAPSAALLHSASQFFIYKLQSELFLKLVHIFLSQNSAGKTTSNLSLVCCGLFFIYIKERQKIPCNYYLEGQMKCWCNIGAVRNRSFLSFSS